MKLLILLFLFFSTFTTYIQASDGMEGKKDILTHALLRITTVKESSPPQIIAVGNYFLPISDKEKMLLFNINTMSQTGTIDKYHPADKVFAFSNEDNPLIVIVSRMHRRVKIQDLGSGKFTEKKIKKQISFDPANVLAKNGYIYILSNDNSITKINPTNNQILNFKLHKLNLYTGQKKLIDVLEMDNSLYVMVSGSVDHLIYVYKNNDDYSFINLEIFTYDSSKNIQYKELLGIDNCIEPVALSPFKCKIYDHTIYICYRHAIYYLDETYKKQMVFEIPYKVWNNKAVYQDFFITDKHLYLIYNKHIKLLLRDPYSLAQEIHFKRKISKYIQLTDDKKNLFIPCERGFKLLLTSAINVDKETLTKWKNINPILRPIQINNFLLIAYQKNKTNNYGICVFDPDGKKIIRRKELNGEIKSVELVDNNLLICLKCNNEYMIMSFDANKLAQPL
jgi:outer membrane protein assembly factor BamB